LCCKNNLKKQKKDIFLDTVTSEEHLSLPISTSHKNHFGYKWFPIVQTSLFMTNKTSFSWLAWCSPFLVALLCWGLWWLEWSWSVSQEGLLWTAHHWKSVYPIILLTVVLFLFPLRRAFAVPWGWLFVYGVVLYGVSWWAYWETYSVFKNLYVAELLVREQGLGAWSLWKLIGIALGLAICYFLPLWHYHQTTDGIHILTLLEIFILVIPCSLITLEIFPMGDAEISFINAVKLGYPVFWASMGLGYLSMAVADEIL
jgi:hypothetical protein